MIKTANGDNTGAIDESFDDDSAESCYHDADDGHGSLDGGADAVADANGDGDGDGDGDVGGHDSNGAIKDTGTMTAAFWLGVLDEFVRNLPDEDDHETCPDMHHL